MSLQTQLYPYFSQYDILNSMGYVENHKGKILKLLWDMMPHTTDQVREAGGNQYNARILELRRDGWEIVSTRIDSINHVFELRTRTKRW